MGVARLAARAAAGGSEHAFVALWLRRWLRLWRIAVPRTAHAIARRSATQRATYPDLRVRAHRSAQGSRGTGPERDDDPVAATGAHTRTGRARLDAGAACSAAITVTAAGRQASFGDEPAADSRGTADLATGRRRPGCTRTDPTTGGAQDA